MNFLFWNPSCWEYQEIANLINNADTLYKEIHSDEEFIDLEYWAETPGKLMHWALNRNYLCMYLNKRIIGFASFRLKNQETVWLSMFYILNNEQGKWFGSIFIREIENQVIKLWAKVLVFETDNKAYWANNFYRKNNYQILTDIGLKNIPFDKVLEKPQVPWRYIFWKIL